MIKGTVVYDPVNIDNSNVKLVKGDKGDVPVKGVDYWTDEDKHEIVLDVLEAIEDLGKCSMSMAESITPARVSESYVCTEEVSE